MIVDLRNAEEDAERKLHDALADLKAAMEAKIAGLKAFYEGQILKLKNDGDDRIRVAKVEIDLHVQVTIDAFRGASNAHIEEEKTIIRALEITLINDYRHDMEARVQAVKLQLYLEADIAIKVYREHML